MIPTTNDNPQAAWALLVVVIMLTSHPLTSPRSIQKGIQIVTSYRAHPTNAGQLIKTTTKIRVAYVTTREHVNVAVRRKWKKFGQAALDEDQSNVTIQSREDVYLEDPNADTDLQDEDPAKAFAGNLNAFWAKQQRRQLERKYDVDDDGDAGGADGAAAAKQQDQAGGWTQVGASGGAPGKYVPPAQRQGGSAMMRVALGWRHSNARMI
jgi:hypothetical protein